MSNEDREAFEHWVDDKFGGPAGRHTSRCDGVYLNGSVQAAWMGWQACAAHYAPKMDFREVIEKAGDAVEKLVARGRFPGDSEFDYALEMSAAALRASGVKFRDDL